MEFLQITMCVLNQFLLAMYLNYLLGSSLYCESVSLVVALDKWESQNIFVQRTTCFTNDIHKNADGLCWCTLNISNKLVMRKEI